MGMALLKYYEDEGFTLLVEQVEDKLYIHCSVHKYKLSVIKKIYSVFNTLKVEIKQLGINMLCAVTENEKFAHMFGGVTINSVNFGNKEYKVIEWDLK